MQNSNWTSKIIKRKQRVFFFVREKGICACKPPLLILNGVTFDSDARTRGGRECKEFELIGLQYGVAMEP